VILDIFQFHHVFDFVIKMRNVVAWSCYSTMIDWIGHRVEFSGAHYDRIIVVFFNVNVNCLIFRSVSHNIVCKHRRRPWQWIITMCIACKISVCNSICTIDLLVHKASYSFIRCVNSMIPLFGLPSLISCLRWNVWSHVNLRLCFNRLIEHLLFC